MLRPPNEFLNFWYLNVIGAKIKHLNCAILSDEMITKVKKSGSANRLHVFIVQNFKHKTQMAKKSLSEPLSTTWKIHSNNPNT
jgi:hypothetical protein